MPLETSSKGHFRQKGHQGPVWKCLCIWKLKCQSLSHVQLFVIPWTEAHQAPLSMEFSRQEYWSGLLFPSPGESSQPRDWTQVSCLVGRFFTTWATMKGRSNDEFCLSQRICEGNVGDQPRKAGEAWLMKNLSGLVRVWLLFWKWMEPLCFFEVRADLAKINIEGSGECKRLHGRNKKRWGEGFESGRIGRHTGVFKCHSGKGNHRMLPSWETF